MTRRALFGLPAATLTKRPIESIDTGHRWVAGPYYIKAAVTYEEPTYYPPSGLVKVEHCTHCGLLRLGDSARGLTGTTIRSAE